MIALGTTVRTSTNPTACASADTGGTPAAAGLLVVATPAGEVATVVGLDDEAGAAGPAPLAPQPAQHHAAIRAITSLFLLVKATVPAKSGRPALWSIGSAVRASPQRRATSRRPRPECPRCAHHRGPANRRRAPPSRRSPPAAFRRTWRRCPALRGSAGPPRAPGRGRIAPRNRRRRSAGARRRPRRAGRRPVSGLHGRRAGPRRPAGRSRA